MSAPHKQSITKSKEDHAYVTHNPTNVAKKLSNIMKQRKMGVSIYPIKKIVVLFEVLLGLR